jgi:hypothetical protein
MARHDAFARTRDAYKNPYAMLTDFLLMQALLRGTPRLAYNGRFCDTD